MKNITQIHYETMEEACDAAFKHCYANSLFILTNDKLSDQSFSSMNNAREKFERVFDTYVDDILLSNLDSSELVIPVCSLTDGNGRESIAPVVAYSGIATRLLSDFVCSRIHTKPSRGLILTGKDCEEAKLSALQDLYLWQKGLDSFRCDGAVELRDFPMLIQMMLMRNNELAVSGLPVETAERRYKEITQYYKRFLRPNSLIETVFNMIQDGELTGKYLDNCGMEAIFYMVYNDYKLDCNDLDEEEMAEDDEVIRPLAKASSVCFPSTSDIMVKLYELSMNGDLRELEEDCEEFDDDDSFDEYDTPGDAPKIMIKSTDPNSNIIRISFDKDKQE